MTDAERQEEKIRELTKSKIDSEKQIAKVKAEMTNQIIAENPVLTKSLLEMQTSMAENNFQKAKRAAQQFFLHLVRPKMLKRKSAAEHMKESANMPEGFSLPEEWGLRASLHSGHVNAIGGFAGTGKTTTLNNLMHSAYRQKRNVVIFSYEMLPGEIFNRLCAIEVYRASSESISYREMMKLFLAGKKYIDDLLEKLDEYITIIPAKKFDILDTMVCSQIYEDKHGTPDMYLFDYVQRIEPVKPGRDRRSEVSEIMNRLVLESENSTAAFVIASQTNRGSYNDGRAASHASFQESSAIEQDSALTMTLGRLQKENSDTEYMELRIPKNRFGNTGHSYVRIDKKSGAMLEKVDEMEIMEHIKKMKAKK